MFKIQNKTKRIDPIMIPESSKVDISKNKYKNFSITAFLKTVDSMYSKKALIPFLIMNKMDKENIVIMTLEEMSKEFQYPKTGLSSLLSEYKRKNFIKKIRNGKYMINPTIIYKGSKYERDNLEKKYNNINVGGGN